jgi:hypothetical protein
LHVASWGIRFIFGPRSRRVVRPRRQVARKARQWACARSTFARVGVCAGERAASDSWLLDNIEDAVIGVDDRYAT